MKDWNEWLIELINCFRNEGEKLVPEKKARVSNLDDLSFPCQVDVIWLQNEQLGLDFQFIVFEHFEDRPDLEVFVHGPIPFSKAIDKLEQILANDRWGRELAPQDHYFIEDSDRTLRRTLEGSFVSAIDELGNYVTQSAFAEVPLSPTIQRKTRLTHDCFTWVAHGNIRSLEPAEIVAKIIEDAIKEVAQAEAKAAPESELKGYGTYFYPPVWIGELPRRTFREKARKRPLFGLAKESFALMYKGFDVIVRADGLLAVANASKTNAFELLNEIMGTALISGLPCFAIREREVGEIRIDPNTLAIRGSTMSLVSDRTRLGGMLRGDAPIAIPTSRNIISKEDLANLLKSADRITGDSEVKKSLVFLLESFTHFHSCEYPQSFVMGWTVVERHVTSIWDAFLKKRAIAGDRRKKLRQGLLWTTDAILETLNLTGSMEQDLYESFMSLKGKRNKILHMGATATEYDAEECIKTAFAIVEDSIQKLGGVHIIHPLTKRLPFYG